MKIHNTLGKKIYHSNIDPSTIKLCCATTVAGRRDPFKLRSTYHSDVLHCHISCSHVLVQNVRCQMSNNKVRISNPFAVGSFTALFVTQPGHRRNAQVCGSHLYVGLGVSAVLLVVHLAVFDVPPGMKNLSGKNLALFYVSFLCSYATFLVGNWLTGPACYVGTAFTVSTKTHSRTNNSVRSNRRPYELVEHGVFAYEHHSYVCGHIHSGSGTSREI